MKTGALVISAAALNVILYSGILPVWEGFDEPFHFGYVQQVANEYGVPDARTATLSAEVAASLVVAPASAAVQKNLPEVKTYAEFFATPAQARPVMRERLSLIAPQERWRHSDYWNYEGHQAPLAYVILAIPERAFAWVPLPRRVLLLRIVAALAGALLLYTGMLRLFRDLQLPSAFGAAALFCTLSSQMTWATIAHVANDWLAVPLAVPLAVWLLSMLMRYWQARTFRAAGQLALVLCAGLLTKAYFLAMLPVVFVACLLAKQPKHLLLIGSGVLLLAGPWYARNVALYGVLSGMQEARSGIGFAALASAAPTIDWPRAVLHSARWALWTGNNSFVSFSRNTLNVVLALFVAALLLWAIRGERRTVEWIAAAHCAVFVGALGYVTVLSFLYTKGASNALSPWYAQVLLAPMLALAFLGCSRSGALGRSIAIALVTLFGYILIATYAVKLIPLYGGYTGRTSLASLAVLYSTESATVVNNLNTLTLIPAYGIFFLTSVVTVLTAAQILLLGATLIKAHGDRAVARLAGASR